jgi:hypothetical protein
MESSRISEAAIQDGLLRVRKHIRRRKRIQRFGQSLLISSLVVGVVLASEQKQAKDYESSRVHVITCEEMSTSGLKQASFLVTGNSSASYGDLYSHCALKLLSTERVKGHDKVNRFAVAGAISTKSKKCDSNIEISLDSKALLNPCKTK